MQGSLEGQTLGRYRVLEPLGQGGMARVYRGYHAQLNRYVAIKVLRADLADDESFSARFHREAQAVAALRHPNIVQVFDFDVQDGMPYMVLELLEGDTLKARLNAYRQRGERMPFGEVVRVLLDILDGLAFAHQAGMVHRDLKPANVLLTRHGQAVVADFGIAQIMGGTRFTAPGALMGTVSYIAPEQGLEGRCDARSDLYALGVVAFEMLTQQVPFDGDTPLAVLMKHMNDPLPLPRRVSPEIPEVLERVVLKALAKSSEDRYASAEEMAGSLRLAATEAGIALPERISLPLSFTTVEAPQEAVAVFSGTVRERVTDSGFAADATDVGLRAPTMVPTEVIPVPEVPAVAPVPAVKAATEAKSDPQGANPILAGVGLLVMCNLCGVMLAGMMHKTLYAAGWPMELFLAATLLCGVLYTTRAPGVLIPVGILVGNGVLFSYYSMTGWWDQWGFLWPLEPILIGTTIWLSVWLMKQKALVDRWMRVAALVLGAFSLSAAVIVMVFSLVF